MSTWSTVLLACGLAFALKLAGHLVPRRWFEDDRVSGVSALLPVALLAALVTMQTVTGPSGLALDSRAAAVVVAVVALAVRTPFIVVVVLGALTAALLRAQGWS